MRALILVAGAALAVAACSSKDNANNTMNVDENLTTTDMNATDMTTTDMNADGHERDGHERRAGNTTATTHYDDASNTRRPTTRCNRRAPPSRGRLLFKRLPVIAGSLFFCSLVGASMRFPFAIAAASPGLALSALRQQRPDRQDPERRREPHRREHRLQRRDRDRRGHWRCRQHGRRRRHELRQPRTTNGAGAGAEARPPGSRRPKRRLRRPGAERQANTHHQRRRQRRLGQPNHLVRLERQAPVRPLHRQLIAASSASSRVIAVHRLHEEMVELPLLELGRFDPVLRPHQLRARCRGAGPPRCRPSG